MAQITVQNAFLSHNHVISHTGVTLRGDKLIRFFALCGATFSFKMATKILCCPYLRD